MTDYKRRRCHELKAQGWQNHAIADQLGLSTAAVRGALSKRKPADPPTVAAAREMLADGYLREAIVAVFGEVI